MESVRFLKTGAEAVAAAVRVARVVSDRDRVVSCGYHGWLDWCQRQPGVPRAVRELHTTVPFNDVAALDGLDELAPAAIVVEPIVDGEPTADWVRALRATADRVGALLILDEIKTVVRLGPGGATARYDFVPDLVVVGKALGNGYPIAAVGGKREVMDAVERTWISSTLATEFVALAAARAVLIAATERRVANTIALAGKRLIAGLHRCRERHSVHELSVRGVPEFCYLSFRSDDVATRVASRAAEHGLLFKWNAYNFPSAAHDDAAVDEALALLDRAIEDVTVAC